MTSIFDLHLDKNAANFVALSPVSFVERTAEVFGDLPAVIHGARRYTWAQTRERSARLAAALQAHGVTRGSTVSVMLPNTPEMVEAHYAVPALNAVLNTLNTRLDAALLAWQMHHCEATVLITDSEAPHTFVDQTSGDFVIMPSFQGWTPAKPEIEGGALVAVAEGFSYTSDQNDQWLDEPGLQRFLADEAA